MVPDGNGKGQDLHLLTAKCHTKPKMYYMHASSLNNFTQTTMYNKSCPYVEQSYSVQSNVSVMLFYWIGQLQHCVLYTIYLYLTTFHFFLQNHFPYHQDLFPD